MKDLTCLTVVGVTTDSIALTLSKSGCTPSSLILNPRYWVSFLKNSHLEGFNFRLCSRKLLKTLSMHFKWSPIVLENINMSSRYARAKSSWPHNTIDISSWKTPGAFVRPNGITLKWNKPRWQVNALFSLSSSWSSTCQYPDFRSSFEKYFADPSEASISSITGSARAYFFVTLLSALKSTQNLLVPSFFSTKTIGKPHGLLDLSIMPACIILSIAKSTIFLCLSGVRYGRLFMGSCVPVSIRIFVFTNKQVSIAF